MAECISACGSTLQHLSLEGCLLLTCPPIYTPTITTTTNCEDNNHSAVDSVPVATSPSSRSIPLPNLRYLSLSGTGPLIALSYLSNLSYLFYFISHSYNLYHQSMMLSTKQQSQILPVWILECLSSIWIFLMILSTIPKSSTSNCPTSNICI